MAVVVLGSVTGRAVDRFGERIVTASGLATAALGALITPFGGAIVGALPIGCGAAVTTTTIPIATAVRDREQRVAALARTAMARDAGAAAGSLAALACFGSLGAAVVYSGAGMLLLSIAAWLTAAQPRGRVAETV